MIEMIEIIKTQINMMTNLTQVKITNTTINNKIIIKKIVVNKTEEKIKILIEIITKGTKSIIMRNLRI